MKKIIVTTLCLALWAGLVSAQEGEGKKPKKGKSGGEESSAKIAVDAAEAAKPWTPPPAAPNAEAPKVVKDLLPLVEHRQGTMGTCMAGPYVPNGFASPCPHSPKGKTSYYSVEDKEIYGFAQAHVHGTGGQGNYGWFMFMPQTGEINTDWKAYLSPKANESVMVDYYSVEMPKHQVKTEITTAHNASIYRFSFSGNPAHLVVDVSYKGASDLLEKEGGCHKIEMEIGEGGKTLSGWAMYSGGWCIGLEEYKTYFYVELENAPKEFSVWDKDGKRAGEKKLSVNNGTWKERKDSGKGASGGKGAGRIIGDPHSGFFFTFADASKPVHVKIGLSKRSVENAKHFAQNQIKDFDFEAARQASQAEWNKRLSRILVEGPDEEVRCFYTFLHHTWVMPRNLTGDDPYFWNTDYWDDQYSTWDTYRTLHPLKSLIDQKAMAGNANFLTKCQEVLGYVPRHFVSSSPDNFGLNGDTGDNIIAEAVLKKIPGVDQKRSYAALKGAALDGKGGRRPDYLKNNQGWIPIPWNDSTRRRPGGETVENNMSDAHTALVAKMLGDKETAELLAKRADGWMNLWNPDAEDEGGIKGFMTPRDEDGKFIPVNKESLGKGKHHAAKGKKGEMPESVNVREVAGEFFGEGPYWNYSLIVNHDPAKLIEKCGGKEAFIKRLEVGFENDLMGLGNEPGFFIPWLACYAGRPDVAAKWSRLNAIGNRSKKSYKLGGRYPGDEDSGAMSSWWIFWAMGIYPNAGSDIYLLHGSFLPKITIQLENGKDFVIEGANAGEANPYIQSCELNGKPWNQCWIRHEEIMKGGTLKFVMGKEPSKWAHDGTPPPSIGDEMKAP